MHGLFAGRPILLTLVAAGMWGLWWLPIRFLNDTGLQGAWSGIAINLLTAIFLLVVFLARRDLPSLDLRGLLGAFLIGVGVAAYAAALSFTDVARAVLLFYLCPAWSTIIECTCLGRRWSWSNLLAVGFSLSGLLIIFGDSLLQADPGMGDLMALASGISWSIGTSLLFTGRKLSISFMAMICMGGSSLVGLVAVLAWPDVLGHAPAADDVMSALPLVMLVAAAYFMPMIMITVWGAGMLAPAMMSFLLSFEILTGIGTSAAMLEEAFGLREVAGTICVIMGAATEYFATRRARGAGRTTLDS